MAAFVPLIGALAPDIINLITSLVHSHAAKAEAQLGSGTGPAKFGQVFTAVMQDLQNAAATGLISKQLPPDDVVQTIIQSTVTSMKLSGLLSPIAPVAKTASPPTSSNLSVSLASGQSLTISAK